VDEMLKSEPSDRRMTISPASMHVLLAINTQTWLGKAWRGHCSAVTGASLQRPTSYGDESHAEHKPEVRMKAEHKWIIVLVAYDDPAIETRVVKERLAMDDDEELAALLRGGVLVTVLGFDNEVAAEAGRIEVERSCLR
jgi:hypothetical protein